MNRHLTFIACLLAGAATATLAVAADPSSAWMHEGPQMHYDGKSDDLVTAGLGAQAMFGSPPGYADPEHPTAAELRRTALFFRASRFS